MMKTWDLLTGNVDSTHIIEKGDNDMSTKLEYVTLSEQEPYRLALCDELGTTTIHNAFSGTILFRMSEKTT